MGEATKARGVWTSRAAERVEPRRGLVLVIAAALALPAVLVSSAASRAESTRLAASRFAEPEALRRANRIAPRSEASPAQAETASTPDSAAAQLRPDAAAQGIAQLEADLVRRGGGEWVIATLTPREAPADARSGAPDPKAMAPSESDRRAVAATLEEYERALEGRDLDRLARIWIMNPAERGEFERFLEGRTAIRVTVEPLELSVDGDRAWVRFQQSIAAAIRPLLERGDLAFWRALAARDAYGGWSLDRLP